MSKLTHEQRIQRAHVQLMRSKQFCMLSGLLMLGRSDVVDYIPTAATDGRDKFYGREFMDELDEKELNFVVCHENFHVLYQHLTTWKHLYKENKQLANMACDYVINGHIIKLDPRNELVSLPKIGVLYDKMFDGWDSGQVYDYLKKNGPPPSQDGQSHGEMTGSLDDHMWESAESMSAEDKEQLAKAVDQAIRQGELLAGKMGGNSPRDIGAIPEAKVDWREQLRDFVSAVCSGRDSSTWRRPNRRYLTQDMYMPSAISESIGPIVIGVDTSGSIMADDINAFLAEIKCISENTPPESIHLLYWDTVVARYEKYEQGEYASLTQSTKPAGGGGTDPTCVKEFVDGMASKPEIVLMLSDGCIWGDFPDFGVPTIWGMTTDNKAPNATNIKIN